MNNRWLKSLPEDLQEKLQDAAMRVRGAASAAHLWKTLNTSQRSSLGGDFYTAFHESKGTVGMWRRLFGGSQPRAIVEVAHRTRHLDKSDYDWLLGAIGEADASDKASNLPCFDRDRGRLMFKGKVVRRVRITSPLSNIVKILDAFQNRNWPKSIRNPLTLGQQQLHETVSYLNEHIKPKLVQFHGQEGGRSIYWEPT